jgi:ribonuclease-3
MQKRLKWNAVGLESKTHTLKRILKKEYNEIPSDHLKARKKLQHFIDELQNILHSIALINAKVIPKLEKEFRLQFKTPEMIYIALSRPGMKNIFKDLATYFKDQEENELSDAELEELSTIGDAGNALALVGDAALDLAVVEYFWDSSLSKIGELTKKREKFVNNQHLVTICDRWQLYEHRIKRLHESTAGSPKMETIIHEKGTLVEAIFGVIYLELGFNEVLRVVPTIQ